MDYNKLARELAEEAHCRYCAALHTEPRLKCDRDLEDSIKRIAGAIERADVSGRIDEVEKAYLYQDPLQRLTALRKRLEELGK